MTKPTLVFLHGWGTTWESLYPLVQLLQDDFTVYHPNLPYPTDKILALNDYSQFVLDFLKSEKIKEPVLIGHSLGGAIATKIATEHPELISKIVLLSAAPIRHQLRQPWRTLQKLSPILRPFKNIGLKLAGLDASDYLNLKTPVEKQTFRNLITADLSLIISQITCPTLILWGEADESTPLADGQKIHSLIKGSLFQSYPHSGHFFYLDHSVDVSQAIIKFIQP